MLEDLFTKPVEIETDEDVEWIEQLLKRMVVRQNDRTHRPLYSPSQMSECLRYVYLLKHRKELGLQRVGSRSASTHYYFFNGNFSCTLSGSLRCGNLNKPSMTRQVFRLHGVEIPIVSKSGRIMVERSMPWCLSTKSRGS